MAVEAGSLFNPQMMMKTTTANFIDNNHQATVNNTPLSYGIINNPLSAAMYCSGFIDSTNAFQSNTVKAAESGLTCSLPPVSRKRARDESDFNALISFSNSNQSLNHDQIQNGNENGNGTFMFLGEDISVQIQQQQLEIDQFIALQTEKLRLEIEERRKRNSRRIIAAVEEQLSKRLRAKDEEIIKIAKINWALEEKVKSLCVENQIWRELAQSNEATANALRSNLKQILDHVVHDDFRQRTTACVEDTAAAALAEDAQSCCESNNEEKPDRINDTCTSNNIYNVNKLLCRKCGNEESCVLLLPCRHLCLCTGCASSVHTCPVCKSAKNISVHVNMS